MTTRVMLGGTAYDVPELNFVALERAWPYITEALIELDPLKAVGSALCVVAAGICEADNFDLSSWGIKPEDLDPNLDRDTEIFDRVVKQMKRRLKASEIGDVRLALLEIAKEAGLELTEGEAGAAVSTSTGTGVPSSQSSSPQDAKAEVGSA